ncbi:hypothetical protein [Azospirillum sp. TSO35-2]|uniref:hypothetical protein n=1 Tax=Azospirillum sp. TSO35-2 TaxID=716796 RepID=UPI001FFE6C43|nr:hypothetical protein [Azospirillum sp. TSO35-2]
MSGNHLYLAAPDALADPGKSAAIGVPVEVDLEILRKNSRQRDLAPITDADVASTQNVADTFHQLGVPPKRIDIAPAFDRRFTDILSRPLS